MQRSRIVVTAFGLLLLALLVSDAGMPVGAPPSGPPGHEYVPGEVLLKFKPNADASARVALRAQLAAATVDTFRSKAEHWKLGPGITVEQAIQRLQASPLIQYAEPNYIIHAAIQPNDPRLGEMWGLINNGQSGGTPDADIDAELAWGVSTGNPDLLVADIDTGIDYNHPDLAANVWTNPGEIPGNGIDDDGNGFVDDVHGYNFVNNTGDPFDDHGHGTHTAGTIGAVGDNGIGVTGVNWHIKILSAKFLDSGGSGSLANAVRAVDYTTQMGVALSSNSWGGGGFSQTLYDAIANAGAHNILFVAAAGNNGQNSDTSPAYPAAYDLPNIISVAATDRNDQLASFSNWGAVSVDLAAPGVDVLSTLPGNSYGTLSGTSMATPHVSGVCALIKAVNPNIPIAQLKQVLLNSVDHIPAMNGKCVSNGRLNAFFAIAEPDTTPPGMINDLATTDPGSNTMGLSWTATGDDAAAGTATYYELRYSIAPIDESNWASATRAGNEPAPVLAGSGQAMEVRNLAADTVYYFAIKAFDEWGNAGPISNVATDRTLPPPTGQVAPSSVSDDLYTGQQSDHTVTLSNIGTGTLDFSIPTPSLGEPMSVPQEPLELGKDDVDPRHGDPVVQTQGGPDPFGYRWIDSDEPGGPTFSWHDISSTGTDLGLTNDDQTSAPQALGFNFPLYGTLFDSVRVCTNGFLSFTSSATSYSNQPLPSTGAPENLIAPFWDDLNPSGTGHVYLQTFANSAVIQWNNMPHYSSGGPYTFQVILDASGAMTFQYLTMAAPLDSATIGVQDASRTVALQAAFNQAYLHDNLAIRISSIPQWLTVSPTSGRLRAGQSKLINLHMNASGLEGGTYPGTVNIMTNDPANPILAVSAALHVIGAPDASVQPASLDFGTSFLGQPYQQTLIVANNGTDTLHVTDVTPSDTTLSPSPRTFNVPPHGSQNVVVTWTSAVLGSYSGSLTVNSDDVAEPAILVPVTGNAVPTPVMIYDPTSFEETLFSGNAVTRPLTVTNTGGPDLIVDASADLGGGEAIYADDIGPNGAGGPDAFGYRWKDSDASGGPAFNFIDISTTGTPITFSSSDDAVSAALPMNMTFPFYGSNFTQVKVSTNGWLTLDTTDTASRYSEYRLPSTNGAKYMLALLWDDLHLRSGNVRYQNDGTRFIVQYTNVEKYSPAGFPMTFQVQLYPNGKVLYMYKTMPAGGTYNSLTIGIQDGTKTVGLTAAYDQSYVHANMAIQFSRTPDWLSVTPSHAVIPPGQHAVFNVTFDSTERLGGTLTGAVVLNTNVPGQAQARVPATLHVVGAPIVTLAPTSYAYGTHFTGYAYVTNFQVINTGTDVLNVSNVTSDDPSLTVIESTVSGGENVALGAFPLPPGSSRLFEMSWLPTVPGPLNARVHVLSDDPVNPDKTLPVTGTAILPPIAGWSPASFSESLMVGDIVHRTLHLTNTGGSDLSFDSLISLNTGASVTVYPPLELKKGDVDPRPGIRGTGGPDGFGYRWRDSDEAGGPAFNWVDITGIGTHLTALNGDDQNVPGIPLGFNFPFYGGSFTTVNVCSNGWLSFTDTGTSLGNSALPSTGAPRNLIAPFWDDLDFRSSTGAGQAYYYSDGNRFIFSFIDAPHYSSPSTGLYTFQVILYRSGRIVYQYLNMAGMLDSATIGVQSATGTDGLTVAYNTAYMHNNMVVEIRPPAGWLSVLPGSGTITAGGFVDLDVAFDSTSMIGGDYSGSIDISTNDPAHGSIQVPAFMHLTGIPDIAAAPVSLSFPMTYIGFTRTQNVAIQNAGSDVLHINGFEITGDFHQSGLSAPVDVPPFGSIPVTVTFQPTAAGTLHGEIRVTSDDPDENPFVVPLEGIALVPPEIHTDPTELYTILPPASATTRTLTIHNTGGSDLTWDSTTQIVSGSPVAPYDPTDKGKDEVDTTPGILGTGGPDAFGYRWRDSDAQGGPVFDWVDITGVGTPIGLNSDDQNVQGIPIGFAFPFYGNSFSTVNASSNGFLSFTSTSSSYLNQPLPNSSTSYPENLLAVFWDDLSFASYHGSGQAFYYNDGSRFIVSYLNVPHYPSSGTGPYSFQVILYPNGRFVYQYLSMGVTKDSATIGIQNGTRTDGLMAVYNAPYVHDGLAVEFKRIPRWMQISPTSGTILAGGSQDVVVSLDSTDLEHGYHDSVIQLTSNDPYTPNYDVPVQLAVNQKPAAQPGTPQPVECTGNNSAMATLSGSGSSDADGDALTYRWSAPGITFDDPTSSTPTALFPLGNTVVTLVVNDGYEDSETATVTVGIVDTLPPTITSVTATPNVLWPPNHKMTTVDAAVVATDVCDPIPMIVLVSATSSEPDDAVGGGDGQTTQDVQDAATGTSDFQVQLRAERDGRGTGRVYTIWYRSTDHSGNASTDSSAQVNVPHDLANVVEPIALTVEGKSATTVTWGAVQGAVHYDVIRGNLENLRIEGSDVDLGTVNCIERESLDTTTAGHEDNATPAPGQAFFYAVQFFDGLENSSYGSESVGRARVVRSGECP